MQQRSSVKITQKNKRTQISDLISPDNGLRGTMERKGIKPKDHISQNVRDLKYLEHRKREERETELQPKKDLYKLSQFRDVPSKVFNFNDENDQNSVMNNYVEFLSKGESDKRREELAMKRRQERYELEARLEEERVVNDKPLTPRKPSIPKITAALAPRNNADFIRLNRAEALSMLPPKRSTEDDFDKNPKHEEFGRIPRYLEERKAKWEWEKEVARRNEPDPMCPPGMKQMPEDERVSTLEILKQNKEITLQKFRNLPFVIETPSMIRKKNELESKLTEIENAINLFSRPKVYIKQ